LPIFGQAGQFFRSLVDFRQFLANVGQQLFSVSCSSSHLALVIPQGQQVGKLLLIVCLGFVGFSY
jgi:hypothetical protein